MIGILAHHCPFQVLRRVNRGPGMDFTIHDPSEVDYIAINY